MAQCDPRGGALTQRPVARALGVCTEDAPAAGRAPGQWLSVAPTRGAVGTAAQDSAFPSLVRHLTLRRGDEWQVSRCFVPALLGRRLGSRLRVVAFAHVYIRVPDSLSLVALGPCALVRFMGTGASCCATRKGRHAGGAGERAGPH